MSTLENPGAMLLDSLQQGVVAALEIGGNRLLGFDPDALGRCRELEGRCVSLEITDLDFRIYCHPGAAGIRLSREAPPHEVDASISGRLIALINLATEDDKLSTSMQEKVNYRGDVALAQRLQKIVADLDIDWEEILAGYTGDVLAHQLNKGWRELRERMLDGADSVLATTSEFLREEARLTPTRTEFDRLAAGITALKHDAARVEARVQLLLDALRERRD